jgi:hypothetical protein
MRFTSFFSSIVLAITTIAANTTIHNNCPFPVWYAAVDSTPPAEMSLLIAGAYVTQEQWFDGKTGTALKITKTEKGLWSGGPVLNFAYTIKDGDTWYDISPVNGYDFYGEKITLGGDKEGSELIIWEGGPEPTHIAHYFGSDDLTLTLCA